MTNTVNEDSLKELARRLEDVDDILKRLEDIQAEYPFLREELGNAQEAVEETVEMEGDEAEELRGELALERRRVAELGFYVRALQEFSRDSHVILPSFISSGFERLCMPVYQCPETVDSDQEDSDKDGDYGPLFNGEDSVQYRNSAG